MTPRAYEIVAALSVFETLRLMRRPDRRPIEAFLATLVIRPDLSGDFQAPGEDGRAHKVKVIGRWMLSYWIDHGAHEIRLTNLELID
ncbi:MAG: hypothetical protein HYV96_02490 [Opitutae bacterium]|nr:hypothetical protein [Opitutae bacterium]